MWTTDRVSRHSITHLFAKVEATVGDLFRCQDMVPFSRELFVAFVLFQDRSVLEFCC